MLNVGDKIKMITQVGKFDMVNEIFEITNIYENEIHFVHKDWGFGYMTEDEFEKHFIKIESSKTWTEWTETKSGFMFRTDNEKYVEVKKNGITTKSSCHPCDKFSVAKGVAICLEKIKEKDNKVEIEGFNKELIDCLKDLTGKIVDLQIEVDDGIYGSYPPVYSGVNKYTITFTEIK